jgi:hypothetical protein
MLRLCGALAACLGVLGAAVEAAEGDAPKSSPAQRLAFATKAAGSYSFRVDARGESKVTLHPEPLLRWYNKVIREDDGMLFLWTEGYQGRPVAAAQFFLVQDDWNHEFQSLSVDGFSARSEDESALDWSWRPTRPGLSFVRADRIGPPAGSAPERLRQMKIIAERFTAVVDTGGTFENPEQLRLLSTPVYRYAAPAQGIVDGALFAFTQGTNPEILMQIEADASAPSAKAWRYGFARMSCFFLRVHEGSQLAWSVDREPVPTPDRGSPYYFRLHAQIDRSAELEIPPHRAKGD